MYLKENKLQDYHWVRCIQDLNPKKGKKNRNLKMRSASIKALSVPYKKYINH